MYCQYVPDASKPRKCRVIGGFEPNYVRLEILTTPGCWVLLLHVIRTYQNIAKVGFFFRDIL